MYVIADYFSRRRKSEFTVSYQDQNNTKEKIPAAGAEPKENDINWLRGTFHPSRPASRPLAFVTACCFITHTGSYLDLNMKETQYWLISLKSNLITNFVINTLLHVIIL